MMTFKRKTSTPKRAEAYEKILRGGISKRIGRPRKWAEDMVARFSAGTFKRIEAVLREDEDRTEFVRTAVERELQRREKAGAGD